MPMTHPHLTTEGPVARIVLDRPERHNAIEADDLVQFRAHLTAIREDESIRVLVLTGTGDTTFCSGVSLGQLESGQMSGRLFETLTEDLAGIRVPSICALNGSVYGGGVELALCCDFRVGVEGVRMSVPASQLGLCYPVSGLRRFLDVMGPTVTRRIMLVGEELDTDEMLGAGFLNRVVARDDLERATTELATRIARLAPLAVQAMKHIIGNLSRGELDAEEAAELVRRCESSDDFLEGVRARREGRTPEFHGG